MTLEVDIINHSATAGGKQVGLLRVIGDDGMLDNSTVCPLCYLDSWWPVLSALPLSQQITHKIPLGQASADLGKPVRSEHGLLEFTLHIRVKDIRQ